MGGPKVLDGYPDLSEDRGEHERQPGDASGQVQRASAQRHISRGQILHPMGEGAVQESGDEGHESRVPPVQDLHRDQGRGKVQQDRGEHHQGGKEPAANDSRAIQCHTIHNQKGCCYHVSTETPRNAQSEARGHGSHGGGDRGKSMTQSGESSNDPALEEHGDRQDGVMGTQEADPPQPYTSGCGPCAHAGGELDGNLVKLGRKARRQLRKSLIAAVDECMIAHDDRWIPEDSCCNSFFHVCMSDAAVMESPDVAEVLSLPRIIPRAEQKGLKGLKSYDVGTGWNFLIASHRQQCMQDIREHKPLFVTVSPPCGPFSAWQRLNSKHGKPTHEELVAARVLCDFAVQVCMLQYELGNLFAFEHPAGASSWNLQSLKQLADMSGVSDVLLDQCMYGLGEPGSDKKYHKTTRFGPTVVRSWKGWAGGVTGNMITRNLRGKFGLVVSGVVALRSHKCIPNSWWTVSLLVCVWQVERERERE